jgi:aminoglycoside phosphotransferase (APT) family kinase protein
LGQPFIVTPLVPGLEFTKVLRPRTAVRTLRQLPKDLADAMADLHAVPQAPIADQLASAGWSAERLGSLGVLDDVASVASGLDGPSLECAIKSLQWHEAMHALRTLTIALVGQRQPEGNRLRRTADVWLPVAPFLCRRLTALTGVPITIA